MYTCIEAARYPRMAPQRDQVADRSPVDLAAACGVPWWFAWMRIETMPDSTGIRVA